MTRWVLAALTTVTVSAGCGGNAATPDSPASGSAGAAVAATPSAGRSAAAYRDVTLPVGTELRLELTSPVGSETSTIEDTVRADMRGPILVDGREVIAAGSEVVGTVTEAVRAGRVKGRARVSFQFTSLRHGPERYDISTAAISGVSDATKGEDATKIAVGAGAGAAIGAVLGGKDGAAKGAVIGGAGGTGVVLATRGSEVRLEPGTDLTTRLTAPLTIRLRVAR